MLEGVKSNGHLPGSTLDASKRELTGGGEVVGSSIVVRLMGSTCTFFLEDTTKDLVSLILIDFSERSELWLLLQQ